MAAGGLPWSVEFMLYRMRRQGHEGLSLHLPIRPKREQPFTGDWRAGWRAGLPVWSLGGFRALRSVHVLYSVRRSPLTR